MLIYRKINKNITPTTKITNAPNIPPTVKGRFFDNFRDEPIGTVTINKKYFTSISSLALCKDNLSFNLRDHLISLYKCKKVYKFMKL